MCKVCLVDKATKPFESNSTPARKAEVHRMMISQTGEGKADKGAELVPPAERTKTHMGRPEQ